MALQLNKEMATNIIFADMGDKVLCKDGNIYEFVKLKRTKFIGRNEQGSYDIPVTWFVEITEKAPPKKLNQSYKKLKEGELFYIVQGDDAKVFAFIELVNGKIMGLNPITKSKTRIDIQLYGGKMTELKKSLTE